MANIRKGTNNINNSSRNIFHGKGNIFRGHKKDIKKVVYKEEIDSEPEEEESQYTPGNKITEQEKQEEQK